MAGAATTTEKDEKAASAAEAEKAARTKAEAEKTGADAPVKAVKAVVPPKAAPKATSRYWLGLLPTAPLCFLTVPGATFHRTTGQYVPSGDPEHPYTLNHSAGGVVDLLPEQVRTIAAYVGQRVVRWRGAPGDLKAGFSVLDMTRGEDGYDGGRESDVPLGRYCYMVKADSPGNLGGKLPETMA